MTLGHHNAMLGKEELKLGLMDNIQRMLAYIY